MALQKQEFAKILKTARRELGLSQEKAAGRIGVTTKTYNQWEAVPGSWPHASKYDDISRGLEVDRELLLGPREMAGRVGGSARLDEIARMTAENAAMLRALLAHFDITAETLAEAPADLITVLRSELQPKRGKARSSV
jgi:transcriptional regulator with XRE-family HTH domain